MTIEQTTWFRDEVKMAVQLGTEYHYVNTSENVLKDYTDKLIHFRGISAATKILKKANQILKYKAYLQA